MANKETEDRLEEIIASGGDTTLLEEVRDATGAVSVNLGMESLDGKQDGSDATLGFAAEDAPLGAPKSSPRRPIAKFKNLSRAAFDEKKKMEALKGLLGAQVTGQDRQWTMVAEQLAALNLNVEKLAAALRTQQAAPEMPLTEMQQAFHEAAIDYTDRRPHVEVTVEIIDIDNFDLVSQAFEASFKVILDWEEQDFIEGVHYHQDLRSGGFTLAQWLVDDQRNMFNPKIFIENAVDLKETGDNDNAPAFHRLVARNDGDTVWLTKRYRFSGTLRCRHVDATWFPWDMQRLPVVVKSVPMEGLTTLGTERHVQLVDPILRRLEKIEDFERQSRGKMKADRMSLFRADELRLKLEPQVHSHNWCRFHNDTPEANHEDDSLPLLPNFGVGELLVCAFGGSDCTHDEYMIDVIVVRDWTAYFFDFIIQMALVSASLFAAWVPFNDDSVANKLSVSLAIVLAIVFFCVEKPSAIKELNYPTMHDYFEQAMVAISIANSIQNVFTWVQCWGFPRDVRSEVLGVGNILSAEWCEESFIGASRFDCAWIIMIVSFVVGLFAFCICSANVYRLKFLKNVMDEINNADCPDVNVREAGSLFGSEDDINPKPIYKTFSQERLLFTIGQQGRKMGHQTMYLVAHANYEGIAHCLARQRMPMLRIFPRLWMRCTVSGCSCCCSCCSRRRHRVDDDKEIPLECETDDSSQIRTTRHRTQHEGHDNPIVDYHGLRPLLKYSEAANVIDCGTGEIGFYQYRWRPPIGHVGNEKDLLFLDIEHKFKLPQNRTFLQEFVYSEDGPNAFVEELISNFKILQVEIRRAPTANSLMSSMATRSYRKQNLKFLFGPTGQNRETLLTSIDAAETMLDWAKKVHNQLNRRLTQEETGLMADFLLFIPSEHDEATYELIATEWLVQAGNMNVDPSQIPVGRNHVPFAGPELSQALKRASRSRPNSVSIKELVWEFQDLLDRDLDQAFFENKFRHAADASLLVDIEYVSEIFRNDAHIMRALIKSRLFNGTLSAGGGSCQITVKPDDEERRQKAKAQPKPKQSALTKQNSSQQILRSSEFHSIKLGNKTPLTAPDGGEPMWPSTEPMSPEMIEDWRQRIRSTISSMQLPAKIKEGQLRGVYIGISAVFYAAKEADCTERLMPRDAFLDALSGKLNQLLVKPPKPEERNGHLLFDHRVFSNIVLVHEVLSSVLAPSAWIICKRNWVAQPSTFMSEDAAADGTSGCEADEVSAFPVEKPPKYVATWSLGFFLNQAVAQ